MRVPSPDPSSLRVHRSYAAAMPRPRTTTVVLATLAGLGWALAAVLGGLAAGLATAGPQGVPAAEPAPPAPPSLAGTYTLTVHDDGCGVIRTEGPDGVDLSPLQWTVTDADGFQVLGRNALGETRYRWFTPGTYDVVLESWGGESYVPVSNSVTITC
jgi:hypothetical protein